jgi:hypothetical protein
MHPTQIGARDERLPSHSITSLAVANNTGGKSSPSDLAVARLSTKSNFGHLVVRDYSPSFAILALYDRPRLSALNVVMTVISLEVRMAGANRSAQEGRRATPIRLVK